MEFQIGQEVEVIMREEGMKGSYYAATIMSKEGTTQYKVEYKTLLKDDESGPLEDVINVDHLRPVPPQILVMYFSLYELADAYENDGWWAGSICGKSSSDYCVYFPGIGKELSFPWEKLRLHQEWTNNQWISSKTENKKIFTKKRKRNKKFFTRKKKGNQKPFTRKKKEDKKLFTRKMKKTSFPTPTYMDFQTGEQVEIMIEEEGFEGSYYEARIKSKEDASQYKVEYKTLLKDDESGPLEEVVGVGLLRPLPPQVPVSYFSLYELADAYQSDGWWAGIIYGNNTSEYVLYFPSTQEVVSYPFEKLRVHQDWSNGKWINPKVNLMSHRGKHFIAEKEYETWKREED